MKLYKPQKGEFKKMFIDILCIGYSSLDEIQFV